MSEIKKQNMPEHVGLIMDGNRRWAKERNLPTFEGHLLGYEKMKSAPAWFFSRGVKILSFFAFSTENWNRQPAEVNYLMKLLENAVEADLAEFVKLQKTKANSENSWSVDVKNIDQTTFDLSVKNPSKGREVKLREPREILREIKQLDSESSAAMADIFKFIK